MADQEWAGVGPPAWPDDQERPAMGRLVDDMLRLARLGQHPGQSREPVDVTAVVRGCAARHGGTAHAEPVNPHGLRIMLTLPVRRPSGPRSARELATSAS